MLTLAIDTATPTLVVGVADGDRVLAEAGVPSGTRHAELLTPTVTDVLARAGVACATSAGSWSGWARAPTPGCGWAS